LDDIEEAMSYGGWVFADCKFYLQSANTPFTPPRFFDERLGLGIIAASEEADVKRAHF